MKVHHSTWSRRPRLCSKRTNDSPRSRGQRISIKCKETEWDESTTPKRLHQNSRLHGASVMTLTPNIASTKPLLKNSRGWIGFFFQRITLFWIWRGKLSCVAIGRLSQSLGTLGGRCGRALKVHGTAKKEKLNAPPVNARDTLSGSSKWQLINLCSLYLPGSRQ